MPTETTSPANKTKAVLHLQLSGMYYADTAHIAVRMGEAIKLQTEPALSGSRRTVLRFSGPGAGVNVGNDPVFYLKVRSDDTLRQSGQDTLPRLAGRHSPYDLELVKLEVKTDRRELETMVANCYGHHNGIAQERTIPIDIERISADLYRPKPKHLAQGEYAILLTDEDPKAGSSRTAFAFSVQ